jgi:hypothetical protein
MNEEKIGACDCTPHFFLFHALTCVINFFINDFIAGFPLDAVYLLYEVAQPVHEQLLLHGL